MELDAVRTLEAERLVRVCGRARQPHGAVREVEGVPVPLQRHELVRSFAEHGVRACLARHADRQQPDLGLRTRVDLRSERRGEKLNAEAHAPVRRSRTNGLADRALLVCQPWERVLVRPTSVRPWRRSRRTRASREAARPRRARRGGARLPARQNILEAQAARRRCAAGRARARTDTSRSQTSATTRW